MSVFRCVLFCTVLAVSLPAWAEDWVLALSWAPGFCATHGGKQQCRVVDDFASHHLTLHGLWPRQQNCHAPPLHPGDLPADLAHWMPGVQDGLAEHEWQKHGSCSGMKPHAYFAQMIQMAEQVSTSSLGRYLAQHAGQRVTLSALRAALRPDYAGASASIRFLCSGERLQEVRFHFSDWSGLLEHGASPGWRSATENDRCDDSVLL